MKNILYFAFISALLGFFPAAAAAAEEGRTSAPAAFDAAKALWAQGNCGEAIAALRTLCNSSDVTRAERETFAEWLLNYAGVIEESSVILAASGNTAGAASASAKACDLRLEAVKILEILADVLENKTATRRRLASTYLALGKRSEARKVFKALLAQEELTAAEKSEFEAALKDLERSAEEAREDEYKIPEQAVSLVEEGKKYFNDGDYAGATSRFTSALYLAARFNEARILAAHSMYAEGLRFRVEAVEYLAESEKLPANSVEATIAIRHFRSSINKASGSITRAIETLEPLLVEKKNAEAWIIAGKCRVLLNHPREAINCFEAALLGGTLKVEDAGAIRKILSQLRTYDLARPDPKEDRRIPPKQKTGPAE